jgi:hypothetical protein
MLPAPKGWGACAYRLTIVRTKANGTFDIATGAGALKALKRSVVRRDSLRRSALRWYVLT